MDYFAIVVLSIDPEAQIDDAFVSRVASYAITSRGEYGGVKRYRAGVLGAFFIKGNICPVS